MLEQHIILTLLRCRIAMCCVRIALKTRWMHNQEFA